ncbi:MAG: VCBS repeat-containing protein, partial [bacterium]
MTLIQRSLLSAAPQAILFVFLGLGGRTAWSAPATQEAFALHSFERHHLSDVYFAEGVAVGDIDGDGVQDVTSGPLWFKGPGFELGGEIRPAVPQDRARYTDHFFSWVHDVNADGHADVLAVGFPGTPGHVYVNPGPEHLDQHWKKHAILNSVANESPQFIQLVGDGTPELVCTNGGAFGYATINPQAPLEPWTFHPISEVVAPKQFGHGLGVGDVDGDGRQDVLSKSGWYAQPADLTGDPKWAFHPVNFAQPGGAEIYAYDVDGDGDSDVITSLSAHEFGLAWHEQIQEGGEIRFTKHLIMGAKAEENPYGLHFSELHSVALADMDGDGLKDIVTGK